MLLCIVVLVASSASAVWAKPRTPAADWPARCRSAELRGIVAGWQVCVTPEASGDGQVLTIGHGARVAWMAEDWRIGTPDEDLPWARDLVDLNGNGVPEMHVHGWNGGASCCHTDYLVELGPTQVSVLGTFHFDRADSLEIRGSQGEQPTIEVQSRMPCFNAASGAGAVAETVVMAWNGQAFCAARAAMQRPLGEIRAELEPLSAIRAAFGGRGFDRSACALWQDTVSLVFAGQAEEAGQRAAALATLPKYPDAVTYLFDVRGVLAMAHWAHCVGPDGMREMKRADAR